MKRSLNDRLELNLRDLSRFHKALIEGWTARRIVGSPRSSSSAYCYANLFIEHFRPVLLLFQCYKFSHEPLVTLWLPSVLQKVSWYLEKTRSCEKKNLEKVFRQLCISFWYCLFTNSCIYQIIYIFIDLPIYPSFL